MLLIVTAVIIDDFSSSHEKLKDAKDVVSIFDGQTLPIKKDQLVADLFWI